MSMIDDNLMSGQAETPKPTKDIYLAGGCFWGTEHYFKQIEGVALTEVGFANGHTKPVWSVYTSLYRPDRLRRDGLCTVLS